jgi:hypothetical protein
MKAMYSMLLSALLSIGCWPANAEEPTKDMKTLFESRYGAWKEYIKQPAVRVNSADSAYTDNKPFEEIVELGIPALPYIVEKLEKDTSAHFLIYAMKRMTKKKFVLKKVGEGRYITDDFPGMVIEGSGNQRRAKLWIRWWKEGRKQTPQLFRKLYSRWKQLGKNGEIELQSEVTVYKYETKTIQTNIRNTEAGEIYGAMRGLGIAALPYMMEKIKEGEYDVLPLVWELTDGAYLSVLEPAAQAKVCLEWWSREKDKWVLPE